MKLQKLREEVLEANLELVRRGLVLYTFGNASGIVREEGLVIIKPSGVAYDTMKPEDLVVVDLKGNVIEGSLRPSSDLPTHLILYNAFPSLGGVAPHGCLTDIPTKHSRNIASEPVRSAEVHGSSRRPPLRASAASGREK